MKKHALEKLIAAKTALNKAEFEYNQIKERFIASYGTGEFIGDDAKVTVSNGVRNSIAYSKVVKDMLPDVNLKKYTTKTPFTTVNVTFFN